MGSRIVAMDNAVAMEVERIVEWEAPGKCRTVEAAEKRKTVVSIAERSTAASLFAAKHTGVDSAGSRCRAAFDDRASSQAHEDVWGLGFAPVHGQRLVLLLR